MSIVIVGGGAAGFFAGIRARQLDPECQVTILESAAAPLGKVKISGGGRCNVTHACFELSRLLGYYPRGGKPLRRLLQQFDCRATMEWFSSRGVPLKVEADGRVFPVSDSSQSILDCLLGEARRSGVRVLCRQAVRELTGRQGAFQIQTVEGSYTARRVLVATGGARAGYGWVQRLGHTIVEPVPSLFTFQVKDPRIQGLAGLSLVEVAAALPGSSVPVQSGPLLVTHWGLSGPAVLRLSAFGARYLHEQNYRCPLLLDLMPGPNQEQVRLLLLAAKAEQPRRQAANHNPTPLPRRLWERYLEALEVPLERVWGEVPDRKLARLAELLKRSEFAIEGKGVFKEEFVTAGGVPLGEIDTATMESRVCPGLFLAGEVLDVDGVTGGFNFQSAWAGGYLAGAGLTGA